MSFNGAPQFKEFGCAAEVKDSVQGKLPLVVACESCLIG